MKKRGRTLEEARRISSNLTARQVAAWCCYPSCDLRIPWRVVGRGKQPLYCSDEHTVRARDEAKALSHKLSRLRAQESRPHSALERAALELSIRQLEWQLLRYRPVGPTSELSPLT